MLYRIFHLLLRLTLRLYFRKVSAHGLDAIEQNRPALILANHTSSFMDPMLLAVHLRRRIHFFVRGDAFNKPLAARFFRSVGMLPIFRQQEGRELMHRNNATNEEALQILARGGAVLIFAEGFSDVAKVLKPLKKGPFRLAAQAVEEKKMSPVIISLGINYLAQLQPGSDAWLHATAPTEAAPFFEDGESSKGLLQLLRRTEVALRPVVLDAGTMDRAPATDVLLGIAAQQAWPAQLSFRKAHAIATAIKDLPEADWTILQEKTIAYGAASKTVSAQEVAFNHTGIFTKAAVLLTAPAALAGWAFHAVPFAVVSGIITRTVKNDDFIAAVFAVLALILLGLWYLLATVWLILAGGYKALLLLMPVITCGLLFHKWWRSTAVAWMQQWKRKQGIQSGNATWARISALRAELSAWVISRAGN